MYWRIKKITPEMVARQYSVHAFLIVSVLFNIGLFSRVSSAKALTGEKKETLDHFARQVTEHIFDANYLTFTDSMQALVDPANGELLGPALNKLRGDGTVPKDINELRTLSRQLTDSKSVSGIKFYNVDVHEADPKTGFAPVDMKIKVVVHDTTGVRPTAMKVRYWIATASNKEKNTSRNVIYDMQMAPLNEQELLQVQPQGGPFVGG